MRSAIEGARQLYRHLLILVRREVYHRTRRERVKPAAAEVLIPVRIINHLHEIVQHALYLHFPETRMTGVQIIKRTVMRRHRVNKQTMHIQFVISAQNLPHPVIPTVRHRILTRRGGAFLPKAVGIVERMPVRVRALLHQHVAAPCLIVEVCFRARPHAAMQHCGTLIPFIPLHAIRRLRDSGGGERRSTRTRECRRRVALLMHCHRKGISRIQQIVTQQRKCRYGGGGTPHNTARPVPHRPPPAEGHLALRALTLVGSQL